MVLDRCQDWTDQVSLLISAVLSRLNPRTFIIAAAILATVGFTAWLMYVVRDRDRLAAALADEQVKVATKQDEIDQLNESIRVYRVYRTQQIEQDRQFDDLVRNLEQIEGGEKLLSPFLREFSERMFGQ